MEKSGFTLSLPNKDSSTEQLQTERSVVIIGANGSGKSRLGAWIEQRNPKPSLIYRISTQKSLQMPSSVSPVSIDKAQNDLLYGYADLQTGQELDYRSGNRWGHKPATYFLNDFHKLLVLLFSEDYDVSSRYRSEAMSKTDRIEPPITNLDKLKEIWGAVLPHRRLIIGGGKVETSIITNAEAKYFASEMSDGERVIFYLIGQGLSAPKDGIIVIDEPELHINKSIQIPLWNEIEKARPDCLFVYFTHDVDFAAAKSDSTKIWLKSFDGENWDWEEIQNVEGLPEELVIELLGSRRPVLFVEGDSGSYDAELFRLLYPDHLVIPSR